MPFVRLLERELLPQAREDATLVESVVARIRDTAARADSLDVGWEVHERVRRPAIELGEAPAVHPGGPRNGRDDMRVQRSDPVNGRGEPPTRGPRDTADRLGEKMRELRGVANRRRAEAEAHRVLAAAGGPAGA